MGDDHHLGPTSSDRPDNSLRGWLIRHKLATAFFLAAAAFYLLSEHRAHLLGALPWLIILACPLMHLFMHHGHGSHGDHRDG